MRRILPTILAFLTGKDRYFPVLGRDFEWSNKSWTHNAFRTIELILGRKQGIRVESAVASDGNGGISVYIYTLEAAIAYAETYIRSLKLLPKIKFQAVYLPQFAPIGFSAPQVPIGYIFAIAYDNSAGSDGGSTSITSNTYSLTITGSNPTIVTGAYGNGSSSAILVDSAQYATVSQTRVTHAYNANDVGDTAMYYLASPATGANNVVVTKTEAANQLGSTSISITGTAASPLGTSGFTKYILGIEGKTNAPSTSVTTVAANSLLIDYVNGAGTITATGSNQTSRINYNSWGNKLGMSTKTTTATGSYACSWSWATAVNCVHIVAEIKENAAAGPANLKSFDGNVKANIKSFCGNAIANIKSISGNA